MKATALLTTGIIIGILLGIFLAHSAGGGFNEVGTLLKTEFSKLWRGIDAFVTAIIRWIADWIFRPIGRFFINLFYFSFEENSPFHNGPNVRPDLNNTKSIHNRINFT